MVNWMEIGEGLTAIITFLPLLLLVFVYFIIITTSIIIISELLVCISFLGAGSERSTSLSICHATINTAESNISTWQLPSANISITTLSFTACISLILCPIASFIILVGCTFLCHAFWCITHAFVTWWSLPQIYFFFFEPRLNIQQNGFAASKKYVQQ